MPEPPDPAPPEGGPPDQGAPHRGPRGPYPVDWRLLTFLARHCASGVAAGWAVLLGLIWTDAGGIGRLIHTAELGWLGLLMLAAAFALTGGGVGMGVAVMALARKGDG